MSLLNTDYRASSIDQFCCSKTIVSKRGHVWGGGIHLDFTFEQRPPDKKTPGEENKDERTHYILLSRK